MEVFGVIVLLAIGTVAAVTAALVLLVIHAVRAGRARVDAARVRAGALGFGPRGEVARLRLELRAETAAARRAVGIARVNGWPAGDAPMLVERLCGAAVALDAHLQALAAEPHQPVVSARLPAAREQVRVLTRSAADLRDALRASGCSVGRSEIDALGADCAIEAQALRTR